MGRTSGVLAATLLLLTAGCGTISPDAAPTVPAPIAPADTEAEVTAPNAAATPATDVDGEVEPSAGVQATGCGSWAS